jgi:hypothetical protein
MVRVAPAATRLFAWRVTLVSWDQRFFDPINCRAGNRLVTPRDAAQYIMELPGAEHRLPHWVIAIEWLMLVGEHGGDPMVPRIAIMRALHRQEPKAIRAGNAPNLTSSFDDVLSAPPMAATSGATRAPGHAD